MMDRLAGLVSRGVVALVRETTKLRGVQVSLLRGGETEPETEHFEPAGLTCSPLAGAEAIVAHVGGDTDHPVALVVTDRRYRPVDLTPGEVVLFAATVGGKQIRITATTIKLGAGATKAVARVGDSAASTIGVSPVFWAWVVALDAWARAAGFDPGALTPQPAAIASRSARTRGTNARPGGPSRTSASGDPKRASRSCRRRCPAKIVSAAMTASVGPSQSSQG